MFNLWGLVKHLATIQRWPMNSLRVEAHTCLHTRAGLHSQHPQKTRPGLTGIVSRCVSDCCSVTHSCLTLCELMDCRKTGLPVHRQLLEFTQNHVHWVGDDIQPSQPLSLPSPPAFNLSQHQGLFKLVNSHQVSKVLEFQLQHQSFQWTPRADLL